MITQGAVDTAGVRLTRLTELASGLGVRSAVRRWKTYPTWTDHSAIRLSYDHNGIGIQSGLSVRTSGISEDQLSSVFRAWLDRAATILGVTGTHEVRSRSVCTRTRAEHTYETRLLAIFSSMGIGCPSLSSGGVILKTCRTIAMLMKREASAKYLPGQILTLMSLGLTGQYSPIELTSVHSQRRSAQDRRHPDPPHRSSGTALA